MTGKTTWLIIIVVVIIAIILAIVLRPNIGTEPQLEEDNQELIGGQTDEYGCLTAAGYTWCEEREKCLRLWEENCGPASLDQAFTVLKDLRQQAMDNSLSTSYPEAGEMIWLAESTADESTESEISTEEYNLPAKVLQYDPVALSEVDKIENYFIDLEFAEDKYNLADGMQGGVRGYSQDDLVCTIFFSSNDIVSPSEIEAGAEQPETPLYKVTVSCADSSTIKQITE